MASLYSVASAALSHPTELQQSLSGLTGSISITAWICLLIPQLYKNYKSQSAEALSMAFLFVWALGDVANLSGALFSGLAPTAVAIGTYFLIADMTLILQCLYYNAINARRARRRALLAAANNEQEPLLGRRRSVANADDSTKTISDDHTSEGDLTWWQNVLCILAVHAIGAAAWLVPYFFGIWEAAPDLPDDPTEDSVGVGIILGYMSAAFYLCARLPQIYKNYQEKSCEGLSLLFFLLSIIGNLTYGLSVVAYSQEKEYLLKAFPWLLGSFGTIVQDLIIFVQFQLYAPAARTNAESDAV